jgi:hypothetical protein
VGVALWSTAVAVGAGVVIILVRELIEDGNRSRSCSEHDGNPYAVEEGDLDDGTD